MDRLSVLGLAVLIGFVVSCGDDKPTEPVHELVGSWTYQDFEFGSTVATNLQNFLVGQGLDLTAAQTMVAEYRNELNRELPRYRPGDRAIQSGPDLRRQFRQFGSLVGSGRRPHDRRRRWVNHSVAVLCGRRRPDAHPEQGGIPEHLQSEGGYGRDRPGDSGASRHFVWRWGLNTTFL